MEELICSNSVAEFDKIAKTWPVDVVVEMLGLVWDGFDQMKSQHLAQIDFTQPIEQLERGLTSLHMDEITLLWKQKTGGFESFFPKHEAWEFRSRKNASSMPPSVDLGFAMQANHSLRWSVEAKVLEHPADVSRYLSDLTEKYLSGKGSPVFHEAALVGYLRRGDAEEVFPHLETNLGQCLEVYDFFKKRDHRVSHHQRNKMVANETSLSSFSCHHLILRLS